VRKDSGTGVKGVSYLGQRFRSVIRKDGKAIHIGVFDTIEQASNAYDQKAIELFGRFANLNKLGVSA
jgi:hypothetical protein